MRSVFGFCFCFAAALGQQNMCARLESRVQADVQAVEIAENQSGAFREVGEQALSGVRECPQSARLWYLAARSAEVLELPYNGQAFTAEGGLKKIAADALAHAPASAPVVTVVARVQNSSALARKAFALDPNYQPARRALADLLAKEGGVDEALRLVSVKTPSDSMRLTRARVLLAAKRPAEAVGEARKIAKPGESDELSLTVETYRDTQEVLGFALVDLGQTDEARKALRAAASAGSAAAQRYLGK